MSGANVKPRNYGRDNPTRDVAESEDRARLFNTVKKFLLSLTDANDCGFVCSCCVETAHVVLDSRPNRVFIITNEPENIASRHAGCRYDGANRILRNIRGNIDGQLISVKVAVGGKHLFGKQFTADVVTCPSYTQDGIPVMSTGLFAFACVYMQRNRKSLYDHYIRMQNPDPIVKQYFARRCGSGG